MIRFDVSPFIKSASPGLRPKIHNNMEEVVRITTE